MSGYDKDVKPVYIAEFFGTGILSLVVLTMVASGSVYTPFAVGFTLLLFVYLLGPVSGCHINPAVTVGLWYMKKITSSEALSYIAAQFSGAVVAIFVASLLVVDLAARLKPLQEHVENDPVIGLAEALGTLLLGFGVMSVVSGKVKAELSGIVIGGSLLIGILISGSASNAVLNPAVALALGSINIFYIAGPLIGAALGMRLYSYLLPEIVSPHKKRIQTK